VVCPLRLPGAITPWLIEYRYMGSIDEKAAYEFDNLLYDDVVMIGNNYLNSVPDIAGDADRNEGAA
jgi:hypothetical protein